MKAFFRLLLSAVFAAVAITPTFVRAESDADAAAGREIVKRFGDTIVSIEMVVMIKAGGAGGSQSRERKIEVNGTLIAPNGLTVTSLSSIDPRAGGGGRAGDAPESEFKEVKLRLADNSEIPARVILKDGDFDLAFIAPETEVPGKQYPYVKLEDAAEAKVLGTYFELTRFPKTLQRLPVVQLSTVVGIIEKPRRLVIATEQTRGCPIFDPQGRVLGLSVLYYASGTAVAAIILPAEDIADMAKQAMVVKLPPLEKPAETPAP